MSKYQKGANAERELIKILWSNGFSVVRSAGSGRISLPTPDIVALSKEKKIAFECKAWESNYLNISVEKMEEQLGWCKKAGAELIVAWRISRQGFLFLPPKEFVKAGKNYVISLKKAQKKASALSVILGQQTKLNV